MHDRVLLPDTVTITDRHTMVVLRIRDDQGGGIGDFDLLLTATAPGATGAMPAP